jgi:hypothetical protein
LAAKNHPVSPQLRDVGGRRVGHQGEAGCLSQQTQRFPSLRKRLFSRSMAPEDQTIRPP